MSWVGERAIRSAVAAEVEEAALVLASAGVPYRIERGAPEWRLLVRDADVERADVALLGYERERRRPAPVEPAAEWGRTWAGVAVAGLLVAFYLATGPSRSGSAWALAGAATAGRIRAGEVWRTVTALTLHADAPHVAGNAVACALFVTAVLRVLGPGVGGWLVLLAGAGGNALNALVQHAGHDSVGSSTAIFGAIGILGGLQFGRKRGQRRAWLALGGSLALLAMLGTGERSDLLAHLFGLMVGLVLGFAATFAPERPAGRAVQIPVAAAAVAAVVGAWLLAMRG
jgi:membrane associated rhomboid family serine protease